jgi:cytochrome P450
MEQLNVPFSFQALLVSILCCYVLNKLVRIYLAAHQRRQNARQLECKAAPSYPHLDPILGLDAFYSAMRAVARGHILDEFEDRFKRTCGGVDTFEIKVFGTKEIHTMEPENVRTVLSLKSKVYQHSAARKGAFACFGHGILASDGKEWEISRAMLRPSFHRSEIRNLSALEEHVVNLIACLPKNGQVVDLQPLFLRLTNDTIFEALLGQSTYTLLGDNTDPRNTQMFEAVEYTAYQISIRLRMGRLATILPDRKFSEALAFVHKYVGDYISRALASHEDEKSDRYLFLKEMVKVNPNPNRVHSELLHTLSAGRETTAAVLSVLFYTIPRYPGVLQKLRNEISVNIGNGLPTYENMRNLKYLKWTINESKYYSYIDDSSHLSNTHLKSDALMACHTYQHSRRCS